MTADPIARVDRALRELRALGAEIAEQDFGHPVEAAAFADGADASRIHAVAALAGAPLPADYAYFLSRCAGFVGMDFQNGYVVHAPEDVVRLLRERGGAAAVLPVGADGGGNAFLLQLRAPHGVLRWDHAVGGHQPVADGFAGFLERVRDDWRAFLGPDPEAWTYIT